MPGCSATVKVWARQALEFLFDVMRQIDDCRDDIVFYGDEGGSWQLCVQWPSVFEVWCPCLAATTDPTEYAIAVQEVIAEFVRYDQDKLLEIARRWATDEQRRALAER